MDSEKSPGSFFALRKDPSVCVWMVSGGEELVVPTGIEGERTGDDFAGLFE